MLNIRGLNKAFIEIVIHIMMSGRNFKNMQREWINFVWHIALASFSVCFVADSKITSS
jgi:hypothetical protein